MNANRPLTTTRIATIEMIQPDLVNVRIHEGAVIGAQDMLEILDARLGLQAGVPCATLVEWTSNMELDVSYLHRDHFNFGRAKELTSALAVVVRTELHERLLELFFSYHAQPFATHVFRDRCAAVQWLDQLARKVA
ncbi:MAG TPA: hypothetical protein PK760_00565 [Flavobacteriales bacterium]|nr:hypothetical protein [Flavobacteriales bacterium]